METLAALSNPSLHPPAVLPSGATRLGSAARSRCVALLVALVVFSLPSVAGVAFSVRVGTLAGDLKVFQGVVLLGAVVALVWTGSVRRIPTLTGLLTLLWVVAMWNGLTALTSDPRALPPLARGVVNLGLNVLAALGVSVFLRSRERTTTAAMAVCLFGVVVAASALVEYVLLGTSMSLLLTWRTLVWGAVDQTEVLKIGGVTLGTTGLARVGGIIGAPENVGMVLGLTLPFVIVLEVATVVQTAIFALYAIAAVVTGSRALTIALAIFSVLSLRLRRRRGRRRARTMLLLAAALLALVPAWFRVNQEALSRFSLESLRYELDWRGDRLAALVEAVGRKPHGWLTGLGLGSGSDVDAGLERVTSGLLGGDVAIAYGLGGVGGLTFLTALWLILLRLRRRLRGNAPAIRVSMDMYACFVGGASLLFPVLMQLLLSTNILTVLIISFLVFADGARRL